jgi:hypothetical protein
MSNFICENINLFRKKKIINEKKRIKIILELMNIYNTNKDYDNLINCYSNIFKNLKEEEEEKINLLQDTENYLNQQLRKLILNNESNFLIEELQKELLEIEKIKKCY